MKYLQLATVLLLIGLTGCATLNRTDCYMLQEHNVPPSLYARMTHKEPLSLSDVIELSQRHLAPGFIIHYMASTYAVYRLDERDIARLHSAGVSQQVIDYILSTPGTFGPHYYAYPRPYYYGPYPYDYGYDPVIVVGPYHRHYWY